MPIPNLKLNISFLSYLIFNRYDLSAYEFALMIGFSRSIVYQILNGNRQASFRFIQKLNTVFDLNVGDHLQLYYSMPENHAKSLGKMIEDYLITHGFIH